MILGGQMGRRVGCHCALMGFGDTGGSDALRQIHVVPGVSPTLDWDKLIEAKNAEVGPVKPEA